MSSVFLTGATGLIGSNIAEQLCARGDEVQALVRPGSDAGALESLGVRIVRGDITNVDDVLRAAQGCELAIHSAAVLGGASQDLGEHEAVNVRGAANVYDAAEKLRMERVVALSTTTFFEASEEPLTEHSPLDPNPSQDPYTITKRQAFIDAMQRAEKGQHICVVISGGAYGPAPLAQRAMLAPSFNQRAVDAIKGELSENVAFPIPWVYAPDVAAASVAALERGVSGERYLAFGQPEDVGSIAFFCNKACEAAGVAHRVSEVTAADIDRDPALAEAYGPSLVALLRKRFPTPFFRYPQTLERLDYQPLSLDEGMRRTVAWLREQGFLSEG
ncbi:MAG: NAD-dependent epimerase/dehydratase family protein [Deltaproteobacteria bacterium]|jgi:dihydroflavonol-4-reductase|nr:NAD-dependent epimerase/dehydratase family protein [Deltaproteobacteria bacterium]MBW2500415.1 NAD-dependent epimerase/dehydratase family protein [Deltaproteobacteria bacterium]